jgi:hypothetical protein
MAIQFHARPEFLMVRIRPCLSKAVLRCPKPSQNEREEATHGVAVQDAV